MKGYKILKHDLTCDHYEYKLNEINELKENLVLFKQGFLYYDNLKDVYNNYSNINHRVFEIKPHGDIACYKSFEPNKESEDNYKNIYYTNSIELLNEIDPVEFIYLIDNQMTLVYLCQSLYKVDYEKYVKCRDNITDSKWIYQLGLKLKNHTDEINILKHKISDSFYAYYWAMYIGNRDIMIDKIVDSEYAYNWARYFGDVDVMIDRVTESEYAFYWAKNIGNKDIMIDNINETKFVKLWLEKWPSDKQHFIDRGIIK